MSHKGALPFRSRRTTAALSRRLRKPLVTVRSSFTDSARMNAAFVTMAPLNVAPSTRVRILISASFSDAVRFASSTIAS
jgi:hypothetical protein